MYKASVIIPVYNAEKTLRKCVESLIYGIERNIEILLIDDCSADKSWELCEKLAVENSNVFCFRNDKNSGVSYTRNKGLDLASAPFVSFVDSDDWVSSKYVYTLVKCAADNPEYMPLCGYIFIDNVNGIRSYYGYLNEKTETVSLGKVFDFLDRVLLQSLWNKVFKTEIIRNNNIRFDETITIGEDFQFVLDYFKAAEYSAFTVISEPLYYYIRANNTSLMSKWDSQSLDKMLSQYDNLYAVFNDSSEEMKTKLEEYKQKLKYNYVYHVLRNKKYSSNEKKIKLNSLFSESEAKQLFKNQRILILKENIVSAVTLLKKFCKRIHGKLQQVKIRYIIGKAQRHLKSDGFSIISQNCIGGVIYSDMKMQFLSPTINTFIPEPDFIKFVSNLEYYMNQDIVMSWAEEYPVGLLDDVHVHFMHYDTCSEAKECWERRKKRIKWNKIFILATDRDGFNDESYESWKNISYPKILFTTQKKYNEDALCIPDYIEESQVGDLITNRQFYCNKIVINKINNI